MGYGRRIAVAAMALAIALAMTIPYQMASAQPPITITHWQHFHEGRAMALGGLKQVFERQNPGIRIVTDYPPYAGFFEKLMTSLVAGTGPDVFQAPHFMAEQLINGGFLTPVPPSVATTAEIESAYIKWTVERFKRGGRHYGMPVDAQHLVLYINDDLARASGLDPSRPPATWDELIEQARRATRRDARGEIIQAGLDTRYKWAVYSSVLFQHIDGPVIDAARKEATYNSPAGMEAIRVLGALMRGPTAVDSPRFLPGSRKFELKRAVFYINHPVARSIIGLIGPDIKYSIAPIPTIREKRLVVPGSHWAYVVNSKSKNPEAAWRWIDFLTSRVGMRAWMKEAGDAPYRLDLIQEEPNAVVRDTLLRNTRVTDYVGWCHPALDDLMDALALTTRSTAEIVGEAKAKHDACVREALK